MQRTGAGVVVLGVALVLAGCSGQDEGATPAPSVSVTSPSAPVTPNIDQYTAPPSGLVDEDTGETIKPQTVPEWDEESRRGVVAAAEAAMRAFARPEADYRTWWAQLEPLLTPQAAQDYAYVDPANVPAREVTGPGELAWDTSAYVGRVEVPTDAGTYTLLLIRQDADSPWLVARITPSDGAD